MDYAEAREAFFQPREGDHAPPGLSDRATPSRRLRDAIEPIATICYWAEPAYDAYAAQGLDFLSGYVWGRASALGDADGSVAASAFGVFEPGLVAGLQAAGREACSLGDVRAAKEQGAVTALREVLDAPEGLPDVLAVLRRAVDAADTTGRPMSAGLAGLDWPDDDLGKVWHACALLREHRGDGHLAACVAAGIDGLEANLLTEMAVGWEPLAYTASRGWSEEAMTAGVARLEARGLVAEGSLTSEGRSVRSALEDTTDALEQAVVDAMGDDLDATIATLDGWAGRIVAHGWFPPDPYKRASG